MSPLEQQLAWNQTNAPFSYDGGVVAQFRTACTATPDHPALILEDDILPYGDMRRAVDDLAATLRARGIGAEDFVGLYCERSFEMVIALWAVLSAGTAFVPLDVEAPTARLTQVLEDAAPVIVLTTEGLAKDLPPGTPVQIVTLTTDTSRTTRLAEDAPLPAADQAAYMIYTSGSTGRPKGVVNEHLALMNRIRWMQRTFNLSPDNRVLQKTPYTFDVSVWEFVWPLTVGATLVIARPGGHMSPNYLARTIRDHRVTDVHFVPSMLRLFLRVRDLGTLGLERVYCSGEALAEDLRDAFLAASPAALHNLYGPTEAAIDVSHWPCQPGDTASPVPIGRPIDNISLFVLDPDQRPVAPLENGELYIGGIGLARGYWKRPELTAERFVHVRLGDQDIRLYRTGDIAHFREDGALIYGGRQDDQVKVNGIRIELGEVEQGLRSHPAVADAVVAVDRSGSAAVLVAFIVPQSPGAPPPDLAEWLAAWLPPSLIPRSFHGIDTRPLTSSGKTDRNALLGMLSR